MFWGYFIFLLLVVCKFPCKKTGIIQWKPVPMLVTVLLVPINHECRLYCILLVPFIKLSTHRMLNQQFKHSRHYLKIRKQILASLYMQDSVKENNLPYVHLCHLTHYLGPFQQTFSLPCYCGSGYANPYVLLLPVCFHHHWKLISDWKEQAISCQHNYHYPKTIRKAVPVYKILEKCICKC